jgi:UDP-N-acetylglucosamine--N-acetylmuramyl-(pentapeptide) pyrophosphoryl-undecaprenol N-acetylglucosamine transferase
MKLPTVIHEQNAVLGRVNRFLAPRVNRIATSYAKVRRLAAGWTGKTVLTGNPVRPEVIAARAVPFIADAPRLRLLVTGGSQGASILSQVVPAAVAALPDALRARLDVVHQARDEDAAAVTAAYRAAGIEPTVAAYFVDLPAEIAASHVVVARAGASTVAELAVAGRPSILVPLPIATDDHQTDNARAIADLGGAKVIAQTAFTPAAVSAALAAWLGDPVALARAAAGARLAGRPDAASALADLVIAVAEAA